MKKFLFTLLLFPTLLQAAPEQRWYQVEVVIFSYNNRDYHNSEVWPIDYSLPQIEGSRELTRAAGSSAKSSSAVMPKPFTLVSTEQLQLGGAVSRIERAPDLELLLHLGWLQPGLAEDKAVAVHVYDRMGNAGTETKSSDSSAAGNEGSELPRLDGTLRLILSRYLHLESDLIWRDPLSELPTTADNEPQADASPETVTAQGVETEDTQQLMDAVTEESLSETLDEHEAIMATHQIYRMQQSRRMRSNEIHYIDHPRFGIVVKVVPYELPENSSN